MKKILLKLFNNYHLFILILFFAVLEIRFPYFFLQDDNYSQFYPVISRGLNFLYSEGQLPLYSFIHGNGVPIFESFQYGFLDPILHISYWITLITGTPYALFDFYSFIYFAIIIQFLLCFNRKNNIVSTLLLISLLFSGHILITLRSWYYICPYLLNLSIILWRAEKIIRSKIYPSKFFPESIWIGFSIYFGNPQFYFYSICIYLSLFVLLGLINKFSIKSLFLSIGLNILPIAVFASAALLLFLNNPQITARDYFIFEGLNLYSITQIFAPPLKVLLNGYFEAPTYHWEYYYLSPIALFGFYLAVFKFTPILFQKSKIKNESQIDLYLSLIAICSFFFITPAFYIFKFIPILSKFHKAFKLFYIFLFSTSILGIRSIQKKSPLNHYFVAGSFIYVLYILLFLDKGFYEYNIPSKDPYRLKNELLGPLGESYAKIYAVAPLRSKDPNFANSLDLNFGLLHRKSMINGYEPMAESKRKILNQNELELLGATHLLLFKENIQQENPWAMEYKKEYAYYIKYPPKKSKLIFTNKNINLYQLNSETPIRKINFGINKIEVILKRPMDLYQFPVKLSYNRKIIGDVDGKNIRIKSENGLMVIDEPIVSDHFTLKYSIWEGGPASKLMNKLFH